MTDLISLAIIALLAGILWLVVKGLERMNDDGPSARPAPALDRSATVEKGATR